MARLAACPGARLWDAGSALNYDYLLRHRALQGRKVFVSTFAPEPLCFWQNAVLYLFEDLRCASFRDAFFDDVVCLSTLEHIGLDNTAYAPGEPGDRAERDTHLQAVKEFHRTLKNRGRLLLSFPFGIRRNLGWFQVFDGAMVDQVIETFSPKSITQHYFHYTEKGWANSNREQASQAVYYDVHSEPEPAPDFAAASRAVVCLELIK